MMPPCPIPLLHALGQALPAQAPSRLEALQKAFRNTLEREGDAPSPLATALVVVLTLLSICLVLYFIAQRSRPAGAEVRRRPPLRFFTHLLRQLGLSWSDRQLLRRAAIHGGLPQPAILLLSPELLERHAGRWADSLPFKSMRRRARRRLAAIEARAFADD
jgi:hypothetical protein